MPWECGRKPEYWERAQVGPGRTYRLHTEFTLKISWIPAFLLNSISKDFQGENFHSSHFHCGPQTCTRAKDQLVFLTGPTCWGSSLVIRAGSKLRVVIYHAIYDDAHINFYVKNIWCHVFSSAQEQPKKTKPNLSYLNKPQQNMKLLNTIFTRCLADLLPRDFILLLKLNNHQFDTPEKLTKVQGDRMGPLLSNLKIAAVFKTVQMWIRKHPGVNISQM